MKTVLITGGAGFIGSHLCDFLLDKGFRVICMDNFVTGNKKNIEHLKDAEKAYLYAAKINKNWVRVNCVRNGRILSKKEIADLVWKVVKKRLK